MSPADSTSRPSTSSNTRRSIGSSAPPDASTTNSANSVANSSSPGRSAPAISRCRSGRPIEDPAGRPELGGELVEHLGQQDPRGVPAVARVRARSAAARRTPRRSTARSPTRPRGCASPRPGRPRSSTPQDSRWSPLTIDVEAAGMEDVDDGQPAGPFVDQRLGVAPRRHPRRARRASISATTQALGPGRAERREQDRRRARPSRARASRRSRAPRRARGRRGDRRPETTRRSGVRMSGARVAEAPGRLVAELAESRDRRRWPRPDHVPSVSVPSTPAGASR